MRRIMCLIIILSGFAALHAPTTQAASAGGLVADTNAQRAAVGLAPLQLNAALSLAASNKAADMIRHNYWGHVSPSGVGPWYWISAAGYPYVYAGENLAQGSADDGVVVQAWMNSPEHRANMLNTNYRDMGCGFASGLLLGNQTTVVACDFGATAAELAAAVPVRHSTPQPSSLPVAPVVVSAPQSDQPGQLQPAAPAKISRSLPVPDYFRKSILFHHMSTAVSLKELSL